GRHGAGVGGGVDRGRAVLGQRGGVRVSGRCVVDLADGDGDGAGVRLGVGGAVGGAVVGRGVGEAVGAVVVGVRGVQNLALVAAGAEDRGAAADQRVDVRDVDDLARLVGRPGAVVGGGGDRDRAVFGHRGGVRVSGRLFVDLADGDGDVACFPTRRSADLGGAVVGRGVGEAVGAVVVGVRGVQNLAL